MGRHSAPDDSEDEDETYALAVAQAAADGRRPTGAHADIALLRQSPALRARCIAAIIIPFGLYVALLVVVGHVGSFLLWVWVPTVVAGVLVGLFLDLAHRRRDAAADSGT